MGNSVPTPNCQLTSSTTLTCDPPSTSKEAQAESQSKPINQSPEYFVNKNGVDLLKVRGTNVVKYALGLLDALYTEEELKQSSFVPVGKSTTSVKPPLSPERMKLFEDCLKQKFSASELKENVEAIRQSCTQKCRDKGKILGMILGQGGKILDMILVMILGQVRLDPGHDLGRSRQDHGHDLRQDHGHDLGRRRQDPGHDLGTRRQDLGYDLGHDLGTSKIMGMILGEGGKILGMILGQGGKIMGMILGEVGKIMGMILGQGGKILGMILGQGGKILGMILGQGGKILDKILDMILVHG
ncbi:hypothetical protein EMCRGX_G017163 [Ephydatia muelleri]